jgi:hypothetical protein
VGSVKAIETSYKGYRFRSRLEARWAVFFEAAGVQWEYEKEGFVLEDGTRYLPDFWLPYPSGAMDLGSVGWGTWLEVKGCAPTDEEKERCRLLVLGTGHRVDLVSGVPGPGKRTWSWDRCGRLVRDGTDELGLDGVPEFECHFVHWGPAAASAIAAARAARFEYGESPA